MAIRKSANREGEEQAQLLRAGHFSLYVTQGQKNTRIDQDAFKTKLPSSQSTQYTLSLLQSII